MSKHKKSNKEDWSYYLVPGRVKRIKIDDKDDLIDFRCPYCGKQKGELHHLGCLKEKNICTKCLEQYAVDCQCDFFTS